MVFISPVFIRSNQSLPIADTLSPKAYPLIIYLLQTFDKRPSRAYFMKGTLLPQPIFFRFTSCYFSNTQFFNNLYVSCFIKRNLIFTPLSHNVLILCSHPCSQKTILLSESWCHLYTSLKLSLQVNLLCRLYNWCLFYTRFWPPYWICGVNGSGFVRKKIQREGKERKRNTRANNEY